eukprot:CAMPEP_0182454772 /NCGR_PEP_ID=MMETSP1319-20130603/1253_1 /TAXON_ID=172717 /ORGANISM="Bolidomonas pacifica, Strain RCC208" /LENGTH=332 /DNA_ID=CAMNT_0024652793 /DNA_START=224 /DNA_END=1219 /DNA_ORIENTATION=+
MTALPPSSLRYDLLNLTCFNPSVLPAPSSPSSAESSLLSTSSKAVASLINNLYTLPTKQSDQGPLHVLPSFGEGPGCDGDSRTSLPRSKPPPKPKEESKWEKFRKEKGMEERKRGRKEFDEATGEWKVRHGYGSANNAKADYPIMEAVAGDSFKDPWEHEKDKRREKVEKNNLQNLKNQERAGVVPKGTAKKYEKKITSDADGRKRQREAETLPVDMVKGGKRGKAGTSKALAATRVSTASMGKFDRLRPGEEKVKGRTADEVNRSRAKMSAVVTGGREAEGTRSLAVLDSVLRGSAKKEKLRKEGGMATGVTGHDYDFDDGLGGGTYRKKK